MTSDPLHERLLTQLGWFDEVLAQSGALINDAGDLTGALRAVVERHKPVPCPRPCSLRHEHVACQACGAPSGFAYPCPDTQAIARELGVDHD